MQANKDQKSVDEVINLEQAKNEKIKDISSKRETETYQFIEKMKNSYTEEEIEYMNSPYYYNYKEYVKEKIENIVSSIVYQLNIKYVNNVRIYNNPFRKSISGSVMLNNIGFPIPNKFLSEINLLIKKEMNKYSQFNECEIDISIIPYEYIRKDNLVKKIDSYKVEVLVNENKITKNNHKTK